MLKMSFKEPQNIFFGKASGAMLLKTALELKDEYTGLRSSYQNFCLAHRRPYFWNIQPVSRYMLGKLNKMLISQRGIAIPRPTFPILYIS